MKERLAHIRVFVASTLFVTLLAALPGVQSLAAHTPEASPEASPGAIGQLPEGPLFEHIQWLVDTANAGSGQITAEEVREHFSEDFFSDTPLEDVLGTLSDLQSAGITYDLDPESVITTMDLPASNGRFILEGSDGSQTEVGVQIDRETGLINGFSIQPAGTGATPEASPAA